MNEEQVYTMEQLGDEVTKRRVLSHLNGANSGGFFCVHGYERRVCNCKTADGEVCQNPDHIEVADHYLQFGISYGRIKAKDIETLEAILAGDKQLALAVKYGVWLDPVTGDAHNVKAKGRVPTRVEISLDMTDQRLRAAVEAVLDSLVHPKEAAVDYAKKAKGTYEYDGKLYIRDALAVHKVVRHEAEYPFKASSQEVAIKDAVRRTLLTGKYRAFVFDGRFEFITVSGKAIFVDGLDQSLYFLAPEVAKHAVAAPAPVE